MTDASPNIMARLRESTRELHDQAEHHEFQSAFGAGTLPLRSYIAYLEQMYLVHEELERHLDSAATTCAPIANVVAQHQRQVPYLLEDLAFFDSDVAAIRPLPQTAAQLARIREIAAEDPLGLLGLHYVLEGSNNGSRFIARSLAKAFDLQPGPGLRYLDPYGDRQRELWKEFKRDMDAQGFDADQQQTIVDAAQTMFAAIGEISTGLLSSAAA